MRKKRFLMSISGGRSSAMLAKLLIDTKKLKRVDVVLGGFYVYTKYVNDTEEYVFCFANTSREDESCLEFMRDVELHWDIKIMWIEAVVDFRKDKGTKHRVVSFETAKRDGSVFEDVIKKYGLPDKNFPHCTREMKTVAIRSFIRYIGWGSWKHYKTILGFRADEPKRTNPLKMKKLNQWWPLWEWGVKKADVAYFWNRQPFDLGMHLPIREQREFIDADGNCKKCWKKSDIKLIYQHKQNPTDTEWIYEMQNKYRGFNGGREITDSINQMFRGKREFQEIIEEWVDIYNLPIEEIVKRLNDKSLLEDGANQELYEQLSCEESCEAFTELEEE